MKKLLLIGFLFYHFTAQAQILNVERERLENHDSSNIWLGSLGLGFNLQQQQTRVLTWTNSVNVAYITPKNQLMFIGNYENVNGEGEDLVQNGYLHTRLNLGWKEKFSYEIFGQAQFDQVRGINNRLLAGAGIRWQPLTYEREYTTLAFGPGIMYEHEDWSFAEQDSVTDFIKTSTYLNIQSSLTENIDLNWIGYYQARFESLDKPRLSTEISVNFKLRKNVMFSTQFSLLYDAAPVVPTDDLIYTWDNVISINLEHKTKRKKRPPTE